MAEEYAETDLPETGGASLSSQLGSSFEHLDKGKIDMRILGVLMDPEEHPKSLRSLVYLSAYAEIFDDTVVRALVNNYLALTVAIRGRGRRDIIRMESVARGGQVDVESEIQRPGWMERNITNRKWEEKERENLGI